jgi:hypothetical protein
MNLPMSSFRFICTALRFSTMIQNWIALILAMVVALIDDESVLSRALAGNTHLRTLEFFMSPVLTLQGAESLANGIRQSNIPSLALRGEHHSMDVKRCLFRQLQFVNLHDSNLGAPVGIEDVAPLYLSLKSKQLSSSASVGPKFDRHGR